jgi:hypothetical protein
MKLVFEVKTEPITQAAIIVAKGGIFDHLKMYVPFDCAGVAAF